MTDTELTELTQPYSNLLAAYGGLRADENITDKQLARLQKSVISAAETVVGFRLYRESYLQRWALKNARRADKWAQCDKVRRMKAERREQRLKERQEQKKQSKARGSDKATSYKVPCSDKNESSTAQFQKTHIGRRGLRNGCPELAGSGVADIRTSNGENNAAKSTEPLAIAHETTHNKTSERSE